MYVKVKRLLEWEELAQASGDEQQEKGDADMQDTDERHLGSRAGMDLDAHKQSVSEGSRKYPNQALMQKMIMDQGPWYDEELTVAWERYMQTEGLCQHICCQHCESMEKPLVVVTPGKMESRRQTVCFRENSTERECVVYDHCHTQRRSIRDG